MPLNRENTEQSHMTLWKAIWDCSKLQIGMVTMTILGKTKVERVQLGKNV